MATATLTKVGNTAAAFIPSTMRKKAGIAVGDRFEMESPRPGVVVLTFPKPDGNTRLDRFLDAELSVRELNKNCKPWIDGTTADDAIEAGKWGRADEIILH